MRPTLLLQLIQPSKIKSIAVIGAGPVGAGLTKALLNEKHFDNIEVFEKRPQFGGLWNYTKPLLKSHGTTSAPEIPCESAYTRIRPHDHEAHGPVFQTPVYKYLDTNVPKYLMEYYKFPFPNGTPLFPTRDQVLDYLIDYSKPIEKFVNFDQEVVRLTYNDQTSKYSVSSENLKTGQNSTKEFDAVAIATGFYDLPFIPNRPGLKEWHSKYPKSICHAKDFDCPEDYLEADGEILIVGNSASGSDIAFELATTLKRKIYKSKRSESSLPAGYDANIIDVPDIKNFDPKTQSVEFVDGKRLENVNKIIFCTGYLKSLPFLPQNVNSSESGNSSLGSLITDGCRVRGLYNHILPINLPTLGVIGLPKYVLPTRLSETQGAWLARIWSGRISLPPVETMQAYDQWFLENNGDGGKYHDLLFPMDVQYSQRLNRDIRQAGNGGYFGVEWTGHQIKMRSSIKPLKEAYLAYLKETGKRALTIEELEENGYFEWPEDATTCVQVPSFAP